VAAAGRVNPVALQDPGDPRFAAFVRTFVDQAPQQGDHGALLELHRAPAADRAFSIYLHARYHHEAIITVTEEGALVLGIGLDGPDNSLRAEIAARGGIGGVELAPPQSAAEWLTSH
jgi:hypothetical protein